MRVLNWAFVQPDQLDSYAAGKWLTLLSELPGTTGALAIPVFQQTGMVAGPLDLILAVAERLAQIARLPLFALPGIIETSVEAGHILKARLALPMADSASGEQWRALLEAGQRICRWIADHPKMSPDRSDHRRAYFDFVATQLATLPQPVGGKSIYHILKAAYLAGIPAMHIAGTVYQLGWGAKARRVDRSITDHEGLIGARLTQNKVLTAQLLHQAGLPCAFHACVTDIEPARQAANSIGWPVVIKPADAERGEGVTVDVQPDQLATAFARAVKASPAKRVLVERQVEGVCHRLFIAGGKLLYAVKRLPVGVYGDGQSRIAELVAAQAELWASKAPWERDHIPTLDALAHVELARQGLTTAHIPLDGSFVSLRRIETTASGGVDEDVTHLAHPENIRVAEAAARVAGLSVAGVDMISPDITKPWFENGAIINEVNYAPMLGEGLISRRHVGTYVERLVNGNGRIPVAVFVGSEDAFERAQVQANLWHGQGLKAVITSHDQTFTAVGTTIIMPQVHLYDRVRALCLSPQTEALAIVVADDALVDTGLPLEGVDSVTFCEPVANTTGSMIRRGQLLQLLEGWSWPTETKA